MAVRKRGWLSNLIWPVTHYLVTNFTITLWYIFFKVFNRTTIIGKENVPHEANTLLLSNHQTMIDSFPVGLFAFYPACLLRAFLLPWNPAAEENFYRNWFLAWLADNWKCIPIKKGRKDVGAIFRMAEKLRLGPMTIFPEGTRTRDGSIGRAHGGAGLLIMETHPTVIPVCIAGINEVLPIGAILPRMFKRVTVYYGKPMGLSEFYGRDKSKRVAVEIMHCVMEQIRHMKTELDEIKAGQGKLAKTILDGSERPV